MLRGDVEDFVMVSDVVQRAGGELILGVTDNHGVFRTVGIVADLFVRIFASSARDGNAQRRKTARKAIVIDRRMGPRAVVN